MKYSYVLISLVLIIQNIESKSHFDIVDDAKTQLENLRATLLGNIQVAHDNFAQLYSDLTSYSYNEINLGELSIDQVYEEVSSELNQIKELAAQANKDISVCTGGREQMINRLPHELKQRLENCIVNQNVEAADILDTSIYIVDVTMNQVHSFELEIRICGDSALCLSPVINRIETAMITLPEEIKVQINKATELLSDLKVLVTDCRDNNVADFTGYVTDLLQQIADCANQIIG